jgi:hypothetical protein
VEPVIEEPVIKEEKQVICASRIGNQLAEG